MSAFKTKFIILFFKSHILSAKYEGLVDTEQAAEDAFAVAVGQLVGGEVGAHYRGHAFADAGVDDVVHKGLGVCTVALCSEVVYDKQLCRKLAVGVVLSLEFSFLKIRYHIQRRGVKHIVPAVYDYFCKRA